MNNHEKSKKIVDSLVEQKTIDLSASEYKLIEKTMVNFFNTEKNNPKEIVDSFIFDLKFDFNATTCRNIEKTISNFF